MRTILTLIAGARARDHVAVFQAFAESLARIMRQRRPTARVRAVGP